jgi:hypothetical protein
MDSSETLNNNSIIYNGYEYQRNKKTSKSEYYRCSRRVAKNCSVTMIRTANTYKVKGVHICEATASVEATMVDNTVCDFIKSSANDLKLTPHDIYKELVKRAKDGDLGHFTRIPTKKRLEQNIRCLRNSSDLTKIHQIESDENRHIEGKPFLRRSWFGDVHGEFHRVLLWATDHGLAML